MRTLFVSGSRNPQGQTARAVAAVGSGAESAGSPADTLFLPAARIERCRQCEDSGWGLCQKVLATCGFDVVDTVPVRRQNLEAKLAVLERAGAFLAGCQ